MTPYFMTSHYKCTQPQLKRKNLRTGLSWLTGGYKLRPTTKAERRRGLTVSLQWNTVVQGSSAQWVSWTEFEDFRKFLLWFQLMSKINTCVNSVTCGVVHIISNQNWKYCHHFNAVSRTGFYNIETPKCAHTIREYIEFSNCIERQYVLNIIRLSEKKKIGYSIPITRTAGIKQLAFSTDQSYHEILPNVNPDNLSCYLLLHHNYSRSNWAKLDTSMRIG